MVIFKTLESCCGVGKSGTCCPMERCRKLTGLLSMGSWMLRIQFSWPGVVFVAKGPDITACPLFGSPSGPMKSSAQSKLTVGSGDVSLVQSQYGSVIEPSL